MKSTDFENKLIFFLGKIDPCEPIEKVIWRVDRTNYTDYYVFSGGLPVDVIMGSPPSITFMKVSYQFHEFFFLFQIFDCFFVFLNLAGKIYYRT